MRNRAGKPPTQRQLRVGEEVRHVLAWTIERGELRDPALAQPITVTEVRISPDLKNATAFVTPLGGGEAETKEILEALKRAKGFLRRIVARELSLRYAPEISFERDASFDEAGHIDMILHSPEVARDLNHDDNERDFDPDEVEDDESTDTAETNDSSDSSDGQAS